jgi:CheY-like chemotaxis protein
MDIQNKNHAVLEVEEQRLSASRIRRRQKGKWRVLLAESDHATRSTISDLLRGADLDVTSTRTKRETLERLTLTLSERRDTDSGQGFDLVLIGPRMVIETSGNIVGMLRQQGFSGKIVAVAHASTSESDQRRLDAGCDGHVPLHTHRAEFLHTLEKHLDM